MLPINHNYSLKDALFWGNFKAHVNAAKEVSNSGRIKALHAFIAVTEFLPIISQIISLCENILMKYVITREPRSLEGRVQKDTPTGGKKEVSEEQLSEEQLKAEELYTLLKIEEGLGVNNIVLVKDEGLKELKELISMTLHLPPDKRLQTLLFAIRVAILNDYHERLQDLLEKRPESGAFEGTLTSDEVDDLIALILAASYEEFKESPRSREYLENKTFKYENKEQTIKQINEDLLSKDYQSRLFKRLYNKS